MNKICIIADTIKQFDENSLTKGCGGSETWVIKISEALSNIGDNHITIICNCEEHQQNEKISWYSLNNIIKVLSDNKFDAILVSRVLTKALSKIFKDINCNNLYFFAHDTYLCNENIKPVYYDKLDDWEKESIKKVFVLSELHKQVFIQKWNFPEDIVEISANGLDFELLEKYVNNNNRDNGILWSIRYERHFNVLADILAPMIKQYIPDFKIYTCSYDVPLPDKYKKYDYIVDLGKLSKDELYKEMSKHKIYFHPMLFFETFCISILEAIMCGCNLITAYNFGAATTLMPYKGFLLPNNINYKNIKDCKFVVSKIVTSIFEYNSNENKALRESMQTYLKNKYSWEKIAKDMLNVMNLKD
jgi:glycosyltransferase involved in cell wall biosynthesis